MTKAWISTALTLSTLGRSIDKLMLMVLNVLTPCNFPNTLPKVKSHTNAAHKIYPSFLIENRARSPRDSTSIQVFLLKSILNTCNSWVVYGQIEWWVSSTSSSNSRINVTTRKRSPDDSAKHKYMG